MLKGYLFLSISIICEVVATIMLKFSQGFTQLAPTIIVAIGYILAFYFLSHCLQYLPLSLAYAIWSGLGTIATVIIGIILWQEKFTWLTAFGISLIIGGVVLLNFSNNPERKKSALT
ncbi:multidrug efflux SMR transporter [Metasolibacillus meyeri]|uniref:Multidrug efflux SMR transporter n=1 Tax=Metasolibacillus meyeri TaxID=1071052 RepID=A0AAW9NTB6_9BACL|nr:multidrug efflux SMR transporter [Metasolibacillus meyeri]MEC1179562.1 multidrug efflux SMR transporter [Metasolibacillus meyeri]